MFKAFIQNIMTAYKINFRTKRNFQHIYLGKRGKI